MIIQPTPNYNPLYYSTYEVAVTALETGASIGEVIDARISTDRGWSPRWQATITIAGDFDHMRFGSDYLRLRVRRMAGAAMPLSQWTARWGGSVKNYTTFGAGSLGLYEMTAEYAGGVSGSSSYGTPETMELEMYISDVQRRLRQGTTTITLHSGEVILQDIRRMQLADIKLEGLTTVADLVREMVARSDNGGTVELVGFPSNGDSALLFGEIVWRAGDSAWDVLDSWLNANRYPLYSEVANRYRLVGPFGDVDAITATLDVNWSIDFDITQRPPSKTRGRLRRFNYADTGQTSIDGAGQRGNIRGIVDEYTSGSTIPAASNWSPDNTGAGSWRDREYATATITRPAELYHRPRMTCHLRGTRPDNGMLLGVIDSITWSFPEGLEEIRVTNLTDGNSISPSN